jgi:hypothetical protein
MKQLFFLFLYFLLLPPTLLASEEYSFDLSETEKKPYHFGAYVEFKPVLNILDHNAALYKLKYYNSDQGQTLLELKGKIQLEGSYEKDIYRVFARTNTDLNYSSFEGFSQDTLFYEAYGSIKPSSSFKVDAGKKTMKWGKGYAWNPVAFVDRPKDPDDPEKVMEGYVVATADYIKSFDGPLKTLSFTPVILPVYEHVNSTFGVEDNLNVAGRLYFLLYDTDIDLLFLVGGSKSDRYGIDFSRNITSNFEVHGEFAYIFDSPQTVLNPGGGIGLVQEDVQSYLGGIRYLTASDLTIIAEYYHNGTGYSTDEMDDFYSLIDNGYNAFNATGDETGLIEAQNMADSGYGRLDAMQDYLYVRLSQKEPFDILYLTPALTWMMNVDDLSFSIAPELLYTGITNLELLLKMYANVGKQNTDFGEKPNKYRIELRAGYYF